MGDRSRCDTGRAFIFRVHNEISRPERMRENQARGATRDTKQLTPKNSIEKFAENLQQLWQSTAFWPSS